MRAAEDRKPETGTGRLATGCLVPLLQPPGVDKGGVGNVVLWSLPRVVGWVKGHMSRDFWDILRNSSSLSSEEALCYETQHPRYHSHKPSFWPLGEQLSCSCLSFPIREVSTGLLTLEKHYDHTELGPVSEMYMARRKCQGHNDADSPSVLLCMGPKRVP